MRPQRALILMTHSDLTKLAVKWLQRPNSAGGPGCSLALSECRTGYTGEIPDAIGFRATGHAPTDGSVVVEVKVSRADFLVDAAKPHRSKGGVGRWRYFMAPEGLIAPEELPCRWGLLLVNKRGHIKPATGPALLARTGPWVQHQAMLEQYSHERDIEREMFLLVRTLATTHDPQKVLDMLREANNRNARLARENDRLREKVRHQALTQLANSALADQQAIARRA